MKLHKNLIKLENSFVLHMKTRRIKLIDYFFFRLVFIVFTSSCFCEHARQKITTHFILLQRLIKESSAHAARRRNDEHEQTSEYREEFENFNHLINENQFINLIFIN
jgi:hypothetical protein